MVFSFSELEGLGFESDIDGITYHNNNNQLLFKADASFEYYQKTGDTKYDIINVDTMEKVIVNSVEELKQELVTEESYWNGL